MEALSIKLPDALEENELLRLPATWEEYLMLVDETPYTIQFLNGEIIGSQANVAHETLIPILGWLLNNHYVDQEDYWVLGSNIKIAVAEGQCDFNADLSVVKQPIEYGAMPAGRPENCQFKNPEIVVEVLSKSTRKFDMTEKITYYKLIPSLQYILFVDQYRPFASVYSRTGVPDEWLNNDYRTLDSVVRLGDLELPMAAIYRKAVFDA